MVAGTPYTYEVVVPAPPGTKSFRWYVTQDQNFALSGNYNWDTAEPADGTSSILASGEAHYDILSEGETSIELVWQSFVLATDEYVFVVVYVENVDDCTTNNLKVYRIRPLHAFTLDIANVDSVLNVTAADGFEQCVDDVQDAVFDPDFGDDGGIVYDFGQDILYYVVAAANFSGAYQLSVNLDGLQGPTPSGADGQEAMLYWDYTFAGLAGNPNGQSIVNNTPVSFNVDAQSSPVGQDGELIFLKVIIDHNSFEAADGAEGYTYTLAIDGVLVDDTGTPLAYDDYGDLHHGTCDQDGFLNDYTTQVLKARPTINSVSPAPPDGFLPITP